MKRIGILTFHRADNFGAVLQNYALQQAVMIIGMEAETIDYYSRTVEETYRILKPVRHGISLLRITKDLALAILNLHNTVIRKRNFASFRERYLKISTEKYNADNISNAMYDVYITGSDQIWNKEIIGKEDVSIYTLAFAKGHTAAYGASSGGAESLVEAADSISKIWLVTVREQQLCNKLMNMGIISRVVCDPVFLLKRDRWKALAKNVSGKKHSYVFLYYLDSGKESAAMIAQAVASSRNIRVHYPRPYDKKAFLNRYGINTFSDGPLEFLNEIDQAEYVVSSSFHGVAFAILMEKEFVTVLHNKTGERVKNLLEYLGLEERIVSDKADFQKRSPHWKPINYSVVEKKLDVFRRESMECLREMCEL